MSPWIPPGTTLMSMRPAEISSSVAAMRAKSPGAMKPGRTATSRRMRSVTAASAVAVVHVSASGAASSNSPLLKRVGISSEWKPCASAVSTTRRRYAKEGSRSARSVPMCEPSPSIGTNQSNSGSGRPSSAAPPPLLVKVRWPVDDRIGGGTFDRFEVPDLGRHEVPPCTEHGARRSMRERGPARKRSAQDLLEEANGVGSKQRHCGADAGWCNGSTGAFGSPGRGSSPRPAASLTSLSPTTPHRATRLPERAAVATLEMLASTRSPIAQLVERAAVNR